MVSLQNDVTLVGYIASEKRITEFANGNKIVRFLIDADNRISISTDKHNAHHHNAFAWGNMAQFIEKHGKVGKKILVRGRIVPRSYLSPKGETRTISEIEIRQIVEL